MVLLVVEVVEVCKMVAIKDRQGPQGVRQLDRKRRTAFVSRMEGGTDWETFGWAMFSIGAEVLRCIYLGMCDNWMA